MKISLAGLLIALITLSACGAPSSAAPSTIGLPETPPPLATRTMMAEATATTDPVVTTAPATIYPSTPESLLPAWELKYRVVGYYPAWSNPPRDLAASELPGNMLTHVIYAFSSIDPKTHTCVYGAESVDKYHLSRLGKLKQKYPHIKVLIAIGGATRSKDFSDIAAEYKFRQTFVQSCIDLYIGTYPGVVDGIDMDWEFPGVGDGTRQEDKKNFTLLMKEFRRQLDDLGQQDNRSYLLTAAVPAGPGAPQNYELPELSGVLDWFNLMTYDFSGAWSTSTNFSAPLYRAKDDPYPANNVDAAVQAYLDAGVLPHKITLGIPFYGRGWTTASTDNNGLYQKLTQGDISATAYTYQNLLDNYIGKNNYERFWSYGAKVPWLYNPINRVFITYEDPESITYKADYVIDHYLGGAMIWQLSSDDGTLLQTLYNDLAQP